MAQDVRSWGSELRGETRQIGWLLGLRGVLTFIFGILALAHPGFGVAMLIAIFGFYALADGVAAGVVALGTTARGAPRGLFLLEALIGIAAGVIAFARPSAAALAVLIVIAVRAIAHGVLEAAAAITVGEILPNRWLFALGGLASVVFGVILLAVPAAGLLTLAWLVGVYALVVGALQLGAAFWGRGTLPRPRSIQPAT